MSEPAYLCLTPASLALAERLRDALGGETHGFAPRVSGADRSFKDVGAHLASLFTDGRPILALMATGALIRLLAPHLGDKRAEPPVLSIAEDGSARLS
ncbi:hypothetical protein NS226_22665, partial [Aureimonas ureilytica]